MGHSTDSRSNPGSLKFNLYVKLCVTNICAMYHFNTHSQCRVIDAFLALKAGICEHKIC